MTDKSFYL